MDIELKRKVQEEVNNADEHILKAVLALLKEYNQSHSHYKMSDEQLQIVRERKARHEKGLSKGYSWEEVKAKLKPKRK